MPRAQQPTTDPLSILSPDMRGDPRVAAEFPVTLHSDGFAGGLGASARDLSTGGLCVVTACPIDLKKVYAVQFGSGDQSFSLDVEGCWQRMPPGQQDALSAFRFSKLSEVDRERLWKMVVEKGTSLASFLYRNSGVRGIGLDDALGLAYATRMRVSPSGTTLYRQDSGQDAGASIYILMEGSVALQVRVRDAIERPLASLEPGAVFGGLPFLAGITQPESAVTLTEVRLLELDTGAYAYLLHTRPWIAHRVAFAVVSAYACRTQSLVDLVHR